MGGAPRFTEGKDADRNESWEEHELTRAAKRSNGQGHEFTRAARLRNPLAF